MATMDVGAAGAGPRRGRPRFFLVMSLLIAAIIAAGFSRTVPADLAPPPAPALPWLLHVHAAVFTTWVLLFVAQPALVARGSLTLHRRLGWFGAGLAGAMVVMAWTATWLSLHLHRVPAAFPPGVFLVLNGVGIVAFAGLVWAGVALRRRAEWHRRLMYLASVTLLGPAVGRLLPASAGAATPLVIDATVLLFALAGPAADLAARRRPHPAYAWGIGVIVLQIVLTPVLGFSPPALALAAGIAA